MKIRFIQVVPSQCFGGYLKIIRNINDVEAKRYVSLQATCTVMGVTYINL